MERDGEGVLARIYVGESDRWEGRPLYEAIVQLALEKGLAGATVLRGVAGFGGHSQIHTARILRLAEDLPMVIELVDRREAIEALLPELEPMLGDGLITLERVQMIRTGGASR